NITSVADLERAARARRIRALKGFGEKKEALFLNSIARFRQSSTRMNRDQAERVIAGVTRVMKEGSYSVAGSFRRGKSTIGDIDIVSIEKPGHLNPLLQRIAEEMIDSGERKTSIFCRGSRVDVRFTRPATFGSMLF